MVQTPSSVRVSDYIAPHVRCLEINKLRQDFAGGISSTRIAITGGSISDARGFAVACDRQSALLDLAEISKLLQANGSKAELFLAWEVSQ